MPLTTWFSDCELPAMETVRDIELNKLFQEVRERFDNKYYLQEHCTEGRRSFWMKWWEEPALEYHYSLYCGNGVEHQCICFGAGGPIDKQLIMSYFYALLNGYDYKVKQDKIK